MKPVLHILAATICVCTLPFVPSTVSAASPAPASAPAAISKTEARQAIAKGLAWLKAHQNEDGSWSNQDQPALSALPLMAFVSSPEGAGTNTSRPEFLQKALGFIRSKAKPDGSIWEKGLSNYNTSVCLTALVTNGDPKDEALTARANAFIVGLQAKNMSDESFDGGIGYGNAVSPNHPHPDLDNTLLALEALRTYKNAHSAQEAPKSPDLNWQAAIDFISRCQNLPETNPKGSKDPADRGGFIYYPGYSNAAPEDNSNPLRSYGTMTYAGLLSFIYADLKKDDQRVQAALDWLKKNYTVDQNPVMGAAGFYYYLHLMSKGLTAAGIKEFETADGRKIDWAHDAARKILQVQTADGSWVNDKSARWMEKDPVLVTSYCVLALELLDDKL